MTPTFHPTGTFPVYDSVEIHAARRLTGGHTKP